MTTQEQAAFAKGRLQGLKEMDEVHNSFLKKELGREALIELMKLKSLRAEYQSNQ